MTAQEVRGSLGISRKAERGDHWMPWDWERKLRQIECRRLFQIGNCFLDAFTLRGGARLGVERDIPAFFGGSENGSQFHSDTLRRKRFDCRAFLGLTPATSSY